MKRFAPAVSLTTAIFATMIVPASLARQSEPVPAPASGAAATGEGVAADASGEAAPLGRLRGEARTADRRPVAGATVLAVREGAPAVLALTATTPDGFIAIDRVPSGDYRLTVASPGLVPGALDGISVGGPFRSVVDLVMSRGEGEPLALRVEGGDGPARAGVRVTDPDGEPLPGVELRLEPVGHRHDPVRLFSDAEGATTIDGLGPGRWRLTIRKTGWTRLRVPEIEWESGPALMMVRMLPLTGRDRPAPEDLLPQPEFRAPAPVVPPPAPPAPDEATGEIDTHASDLTEAEAGADGSPGATQDPDPESDSASPPASR